MNWPPSELEQLGVSPPPIYYATSLHNDEWTANKFAPEGIKPVAVYLVADAPVRAHASAMKEGMVGKV